MNKNETTIYFNPKCTKCRLSLELLREKACEPNIIEYLSETPTKSELQDILALLGIPATGLLRKKEPAYQKSGLSDESTEDEILTAMTETPILIERPIIIHNGKATIGRPPEKILDIL